MVTVLRVAGLRLVIFLDDHEPAHLHVFGDGHAKINLAGADGFPELVWAVGLKRSDIREAIRIVTEQRDHLMMRWREIHG